MSAYHHQPHHVIDSAVKQFVDSGFERNRFEDSNVNYNLIVPNNSQDQLQSQTQGAHTMKLVGGIDKYDCPKNVVIADYKKVPIFKKEYVPQLRLVGYKNVECGTRVIGKVDHCGKILLDCKAKDDIYKTEFSDFDKDYVTLEVPRRRKCRGRCDKKSKCKKCHAQ